MPPSDRRQALDHAQPQKPPLNLVDILLRGGVAVCGTAALTAFIMVANVWKDVSILQAENNAQGREIIALQELYRLHAEADQRREEARRNETQAAAVAGARFDTTLIGLKGSLDDLLRSLRRR